MADESLLYDVLVDKVNQLSEMELSDDKHNYATKDVTDLYRTQLEEIKIGLDEQARQAKSDYDFERLRLEDKRKKEELEARTYEAEVEDRKSKRDLIGKIAAVGAMFGLTIGTFIYEDRDNIMPRDKLKFVDKLKIW